MKRERISGAAVASRFVLLVWAAASIGGCCTDHDVTQCFEWAESMTCPPPEEAEAAGKLGGESLIVNGPGTFWPAHEYLIDGAHETEPAQCCYETTTTTCTSALH